MTTLTISGNSSNFHMPLTFCTVIETFTLLEARVRVARFFCSTVVVHSAFTVRQHARISYRKYVHILLNSDQILPSSSRSHFPFPCHRYILAEVAIEPLTVPLYYLAAASKVPLHDLIQLRSIYYLQSSHISSHSIQNLLRFLHVMPEPSLKTLEVFSPLGWKRAKPLKVVSRRMCG